MYDADIELENDHIHEITFALGYYPYGQNLRLGLEYRGLYPAKTDRSYLAPWNVWFDYLHEITLAAQVSF